MRNGRLREKIKKVLADIRDEYLQDHDKPWIVAFSGGKDSTLITHLVVESLLAIPPDKRKRKVYVLYNDTLVESPVFQQYVENALGRIKDGIQALNLPVVVVKTTPPMEETFWVNLLGKGYPAPNRSFRWCMDRLKIQPTSQFIKQRISESGECILLLGVRKAESAARHQRINKYLIQDNHSRLSDNKDIAGCKMFRPIMDLTTDEVWQYLDNNLPPWGGKTNLSLLEIYRDAGMCNATQKCALMDEDTALESPPILARFGCWTCTVIEKDRSLESLIESGYKELTPLVEFRALLREYSDNPAYRNKTRRNGQPGLGPLTFEARDLLLQKLLEIQSETGLFLITNAEVLMIKEWWTKDRCSHLVRKIGKIRPAQHSKEIAQ